MRMHLLHLGQVRIHEVAEQHLGMQRPPGVGQLDMRHTVDSTLLKDGKSGPGIVKVRPEYAHRGIGRKCSGLALFVMMAIPAMFLPSSTKDRRKEPRLLFFL